MDTKQFISWLKDRHAQAMGRENEALALLAKGDVDGYRSKMREKAEILSRLADDASAAGFAERLAGRLRQFSESAATALALNSVFYMSALLYPDDHKKGEPDNLQKFIVSLESEKGDEA